MPATGQLVRDASDVVVDLVRDLPGERRHLRDREPLGWGMAAVYFVYRR